MPAPLLISVANTPLSWLLFHIVVSSSARDPLRPFPHPPRLQTANWQGKGIAESCWGAIVIIAVVLDESASPPPPPNPVVVVVLGLLVAGDGRRGGGTMQLPVVAAFSAYIVVIVLPPCRLNPRHLSCCTPAGLPALPPPLPHHAHHWLVPTGGCRDGHDRRDNIGPSSSFDPLNYINMNKHIICLLFCNPTAVTKAKQRHTKPWNIDMIFMDVLCKEVGRIA